MKSNQVQQEGTEETVQEEVKELNLQDTTNVQEKLLRRTTRSRRNPSRIFTLLMSFIMFGLMMISDVTSKIIIKDNNIFQRKPDVAFSESSWTISTDLVLKTRRKNNTIFEVQQMVSEHDNSRIGLYRQDLDVCKERKFILRTSTGDLNNRKGRQLTSEGGTLLKWLYELPTGGGSTFNRVNSIFLKRRIQYNNSLVDLSISLEACGSFHTLHRHRIWNLRRLPTLALPPQNDHQCEVRAGDGRDRHAAG